MFLVLRTLILTYKNCASIESLEGSYMPGGNLPLALELNFDGLVGLFGSCRSAGRS